MFTAVTEPYRGQSVTLVRYVVFSKIVFYEAAVSMIFSFIVYTVTRPHCAAPHLAPMNVLWTEIRCCTTIQFIATIDIPPQTAVNQKWRSIGVRLCVCVDILKGRQWSIDSSVADIQYEISAKCVWCLTFSRWLCVETDSKSLIYIQIFIFFYQE